MEYAGKDISAIMSDTLSHEHSEGAYDILQEYFVGTLSKVENAEEVEQLGLALSAEDSMTIVDPISHLDDQLTEELASAKKPLLDLKRPLFYQMMNSTFSKEYYLTQVHIPRHLPEPATIFGNPVLETLTRTPWYVVPSVWIPVIMWLASVALQVMSPLALLGYFSCGLVVWSFFEYTFHRFLFHIDDYLPDNRYALTLHFLMHGIHHYVPMDRMRLVLPPIFFAIIVQPPWWAFRLVFDYAHCAALFTGGIAGYVFYDLTHYYLHHARVRTSHMRSMKTYHLAHHYKSYDSGYGITSKFWDYVFGTVLDESLKSQ
jgi:4-hydroxysphinganine ceramide fatty acyl 2-hydroxylase